MFIAGKGMTYEKIGDGKCNLIYIDDLVGAIILMLDHEKAVGEAFNINGSDEITWNEYFIKYNDAMGLPPLKCISYNQAIMKTITMEPVRTIGKIVRNNFMNGAKKLADTFDTVKILMKGTESALKTVSSSDELKLYSRDAVYANKKAEDLLKYIPTVSVAGGLSITVDWLRTNKIIL